MKWTSEGGAWRVEVRYTGNRHKIRTVSIRKWNRHEGVYKPLHKRHTYQIPFTVLSVYDEFISLGMERY
ncbi:hypothetical protein SporoP37_02090 [Sporosarcina sp. P37]|uniref:hypothetical protein n=1 Tax=unclassified Sporosarcina TaxID=2647733 RepID=UPI000A17B699|nr:MULTISPECIES: hypothetical protein [unclassified Sporosarcina]ARK23598.1 hypothetical protein SporoP37_02090 [Sporosarcina sp. P37]PID18778.1 hypothetical protein CSV62_06660 [Sporosarcina sp. P35]